MNLGCTPAVAREAEGRDGDILCVATPHYKNGGSGGTGAHPGFVVRLPVARLRAAGFRAADIALADGARLGRYADPTSHRKPICAECILAGEVTLAGYVKIAHSTAPCWSCCRELEEARQQERENETKPQ